MEHVLIQVALDCFQLGLSFLRWFFVTHLNISNYWDSQTGFRDKSSEMKMEPSVMCACLCMCDKPDLCWDNIDYCTIIDKTS